MTDISHMIRQSEFTTWDFCRRLHNLQYTRRLSPIPSEGRRMPADGQRDVGTVYHAGVEVIHNDGRMMDATIAMWDKIEELRQIRMPDEGLPAVQDDPEWWDLGKLAEIMLQGYVEWLEEEGIDAGAQTRAVEEKWEVPLADTGVTVFGQWDLVQWSHQRGGILVDDGKTVGPLDQPHRADFQLRTYSWAWWRKHGEAPVGARHRQARRVKRTARAKPPFYAVPEIPMNETILAAHEAQMIERAQDILTARTRDTSDPMLYPRTSRDCSWRCPFGDICPMIDDGDDFEFVLEQNFYVREEGEDS